MELNPRALSAPCILLSRTATKSGPSTALYLWVQALPAPTPTAAPSICDRIPIARLTHSSTATQLKNHLQVMETTF